MHLLRLLAVLLLALAARPALAEDARGDWIGSLQVAPTTTLRIAVHIEDGGNGAFTGTFDSLDQNANGLPLSDIQATPETLSFTVPVVNGSYSGRWDAERRVWDGIWSQGVGGLPLALARGGNPPLPPSRPSALPADWRIPSDAEIGRLIEERIAGRNGEGIAIGVIDEGERRTVARGPAGAAPFDAHTLFEIGSMTKVFTGLLLADMVERGEVKLDDPVQAYLPHGATVPERGGRKITLLDLATHRSGLPRLPANMPYGDPANPYADYGEDQMLAFLKDHQLTRDIGSQFEYSNLGFGLLGYALARAAGTDYASLVRERITGPLGMNDTAIALSPAQQARFATPHDAYMRPTSPWDLPALSGAGALRSTVDDMLIFLAAATGASDGPLKQAAALATQKHAQGPGPATDMGLGWMRANTQAGLILMHDGGTGGFRTSMMFDPASERGIVVLTNAAAEPSAGDLALHLLIGTPIAPTSPIPDAPPTMRSHETVTLSAAELDRVVGTYRFTPQLSVTITREGDSLFIQSPGSPRLPLPASAPLHFFVSAVNAEFVFDAKGDGEATGVTLKQNGQELKGRKEE